MALANRTALLATAHSLSIDRVAAEVAGAFEASGVNCMLVKGPATVRALYGDGARRTYVDCDILVREGDVPRADALLDALGFHHPDDEDAGVVAEIRHSHTWTRAHDRAVVDLHWTFAGLASAAAVVWAELHGRAEPALVGGREVLVADAATTVTLAVLQLFLHGPHNGAKFQRDVERALERLPEATWREAMDVASAIGAAPAFGAGLRMTPGGAETAARLGAPDDAVGRALGGGSGTEQAAEMLEIVARRPGAAAKLRLLTWLLFPPRAYLERLHPWARRGGLKLAAVYAVRPFYLAARAPATVLTWRRARRSADG